MKSIMEMFIRLKIVCEDVKLRATDVDVVFILVKHTLYIYIRYIDILDIR